MKPETERMLTALMLSKNENCSNLAARILAGATTVEIERKYTGSFMSAVLDGDIKRAIICADSQNKKVLELL